MARIADDELERLKREVSVQRLVEARGVKLHRHGKDLIGLCPFHDDKRPSLVVTPEMNLFHCLGACNTGGSVIDWVMKAEGVSFRHAVELLRSDSSSLAALPPTANMRTRQKGPVPKVTTVRRLDAPFAPSASDEELLRSVVDYYHAALGESPEALDYLERRGLLHEAMIDRFHLGYANRTLGFRLPHKNRKRGAELRGRLEALGILRASGHEHLNGSIVVPLFDEVGNVVGMYGRKVSNQLRAGTPLHLYLRGSHRGVFNREALEQSEEIILCESLFDALTFWCAGHQNVTASYGVNGFTDDHREAFKRHGVKRVFLAYDRDEAGDRGAEALAPELAAMGMEVLRVLFPHGMDANDYALKLTPARESLNAALRGATWMAGKRAPRLTAISAPVEPEAAKKNDAAAADKKANAVPPPRPSLLAATATATLPPTPAPAVQGGEVAIDASGEVHLDFGDRRWRIRGFDPMAKSGELRINALVNRNGAFHVDTLELYSARQRAAFLKMASDELALDERLVKKDLGAVLLELERLQEEARVRAAAPKSLAPEMSDGDREQALSLLRNPHLLERVLEDFERLGVVGERDNKLVAYLAATSRKLDEPLAVVIQSSSAAGKSSLMEAVLSLVPEEERVQYSAMTGQSLFYMGEEDLKHKVLAIVEEEGAERASYALKLLQSEGELTIASTGKDPQTGKLVTHAYRVEGPVMIMLTTTAIDVDEELLNRCIVLSVDEGRAQTRAIHERQRRAQTLAGVLERRERQRLVALHRNAQRLLRPLVVVNPFAEALSFFDHKTRARRDHMKYLTLIRTIALLHQYQRPVKKVEHAGEVVHYIEVTQSDIALADRICEKVLARAIDEVPTQTRRLLAEIQTLVERLEKEQGLERHEVRFSRRDVREHTGWGQTQLKVHMHRLEELEYLLVHGGGPRRRLVYELAHHHDTNWSASKATGRPLVGAPPRPEEPSDVARLSKLVGVAAPHRSGNGANAPVLVVHESAAES